MLPSGVPVQVKLFGKGFSDTIRPEDIAIYGPGITVRPASLQFSGSALYGSLSFTADVPLQPEWADAVIIVRSGSAAAVYCGMRIMPAGPQLAPGGVVNAASYRPGPVAPGEIVSLFGTGIGPETPFSGTFDSSDNLVTSLGETAVEFDDRPAPLFYVSSVQVNAQVPFEVAARASTRVRLRYRDSTAEVILPVAAASPAIFGGFDAPAVVNQNGTMNDSRHPAPRGSIIVAYGTGLGALDPPLATGAKAAASPLSRAAQVAASIGEVDARVDFAGMAPGFVGLMQLNIAVPETAPAGSVPLKLLVNGIPGSSPACIVVE